jgi:hypothetical protein
MRVRHVDRAAAEHDVLRLVRKAREEHQARGHVLGEVGDVLADERLAIAEPVGQQDCLAVLCIRLHGWRPAGCSGIMKVPSLIQFSTISTRPLAAERKNRLQRRNVGDHLLLRHRVRHAARDRVRKRFQVREHRACGRIVSRLRLASARAGGERPSLGCFRVRLVADFRPTLVAEQGEAADERLSRASRSATRWPRCETIRTRRAYRH